jgi:membrane protein implicated in regulation of membrane protease activity
MRPAGPQPPGVYWVRRILVLAVLLLVVLGAAKLVQRVTRSTTAAAPAVSTTPAVSTSTTTPSTATTPPATSKTPSPSATQTGTGTCTDSQITVTASTDAASYPVGATPHLRMKIENTSSTACKRDIGAAQNELIITSGSAHVWSSDDCTPGGDPQVETIAPGQSFSVAVTWLGKLSQKGCPTNQPSATKGTYKLVGRNGPVTSSPAVFSLT